MAVNLLPWRQQRRQRQRRQSLLVLALVTGGLLLLVMQQAYRVHEARQRIAQESRMRQQALETLAARLAQQKQLLEQLALLQKQQAKQRDKAAQLAGWQQFWRDLPGMLPDTAWLTRLEKRDNRLILEGQAQDMAAIRQFRQQLATATLLGQVQQGGVRRQADGRYHFSLRAQIAGGRDD